MQPHKLIAITGALLLAAAANVIPTAAQAGDIRAGYVGWVAPSMGFTITFATPMPNARYIVSIQQTNSGGYSTTTDCTYFNVLHLTPSGFDLQHKACKGGAPVPTNGNITIGYIAVSEQP